MTIVGPQNRGRDFPNLVRRVQAGDPISAFERNIIGEVLDRLVTGFDGPLSVAGTANINAKLPFWQVRIKAVLGDYISCVEYDGDEEELCDLLAAMVGAGIKVVEFHQERVDLEDLFMSVTKGVVS